jgi:hypothetical protein
MQEAVGIAHMVGLQRYVRNANQPMVFPVVMRPDVWLVVAIVTASTASGVPRIWAYQQLSRWTPRSEWWHYRPPRSIWLPGHFQLHHSRFLL